jgi:hypothetical protein
MSVSAWRLVEREGENREVLPLRILAARGEAGCPEEGGSWGKHGFPHATEPEAEEDAT